MADQNKKTEIVIDASVASASGGGTTTAPYSINARSTLLEIEKSDRLHFVLTPPLKAEWNDHQSKFALRWRTRMTKQSRLRLLKTESEYTNYELRDAVRDYTPEHDHAMIYKDCHLIEASLVSDRTVISFDERVRVKFAGLCAQYALLQGVMWVNPNDERIIFWLRNGAGQRKEYLLQTPDTP